MNSRNRKIIIGVLALFLVLSVGYALFSETLNINGNATASGNFDLEFTSVGNITKVGYTDIDKIGDSNIAVISPDKNTLTITVNKLDYPGAYVEIPVVITNKGTITGELEAINREDFITSENIKLTYTSVEEIGKIFEPNVSKDMIIRIEWDENINKSSEEKLQFKLSLSYKQATSSDTGGSNVPGGSDQNEGEHYLTILKKLYGITPMEEGEEELIYNELKGTKMFSFWGQPADFNMGYDSSYGRVAYDKLGNYNFLIFGDSDGEIQNISLMVDGSDESNLLNDMVAKTEEIDSRFKRLLIDSEYTFTYDDVQSGALKNYLSLDETSSTDFGGGQLDIVTPIYGNITARWIHSVINKTISCENITEF